MKSEQVVVHFAGGGGSCTGMEMALGKSPDHAINHDAAALGMHRSNHEHTQHHVEDRWILKKGGRLNYG